MTNTNTNPLSAAAIAAAARDLGAGALLLQPHANAVARQPRVTLSPVNTLSQDQGAAIAVAEASLSEVVPGVVAVMAPIGGFNSQLKAMAPKLAALAATLDDPGTDATTRAQNATTLADGLALLAGIAARGGTSVTSIAGSLDTLTTKAGGAASALARDQSAAQTALTGGAIPALVAQLAAVQTAIDADNQLIARGAMSGLIAALKVGIGIATEYESDGAKGKDLIVGGFRGAVKQSDEAQAALDDERAQFETYKRLVGDLTQAQFTLATIQALALSTSALAADLQGTEGASGALSDAWHALEAGLTSLADAIRQDPSSSHGLGDDLASALPQWQALGTQVGQFQSGGMLAVES